MNAAGILAANRASTLLTFTICAPAAVVSILETTEDLNPNIAHHKPAPKTGMAEATKDICRGSKFLML